ncbi:dienelactone hydrolase family protein [Paraburkholderia silvatlantica]|uniref:Carboxymethylenebutenolidase n=1 Tax=Paraburkholderia silvatlantica TaxID=321895 RepID=A0ABR6FU56_9BURK|nr:dienelactone hydrolase family protein [Paraburkholderia silvatlantica]MBB2930632.1 carboxymethylenebutenolidase [Paraburkholderia silvatlantica]PVY30433.1 carboxymethylenebutenolidase [Paraburkholderia silvatlantica]PXW36830.1 carboxymethylenebutenolidase [Paraburkholderia silvatlantica]
MSSRTIQVSARDGGHFSAYLATPAQGSGPGLVLVQEIFGINGFMKAMADRYAEEGYVVLVPDLFWRMKPGVVLGYGEDDFKAALDYHERLDETLAVEDIAATLDAARALPEQAGKVGLIGYCLGGRLAMLSAARTDVDCAISYYGVNLQNHLDEAASIRCPIMFHFPENDAFCPPEARERIVAAFADRPGAECYVYPGCDHAFATPERPQYDKPAALMAYSRTMAMLRKVLGPIYDLNTLWERHCYYEFATRDVGAVMPTMVAEPYVNHVPTMTGGVGHDQLKRFYKYHFVDANPADTTLIPVSRTIGADRIVDEFVFCATHDREIDWLLPGLAPTGKYFEVPMLAVVCFRGDKLYNEHIYWDQASVLVQIGVLDPAGLPVAGIQTAKKLIDEALPSNTLMPNWASSEGKPT